MAEDRISFQQGSFAIFEGDTPDQLQTIARFIPFRFNPEQLSRQLSIEQAQGQGAQPATGDAASGSDQNSADQGADADSGSLKEAFSVMLRFDLAYREETRSSMPLEFGVLPEISALEDLMHPVESASDQPSDGGEPTRARGRRPLVLFVWGERRVVPVKITGMTITEQFFNGQLYPTRAEVEVSLETLGEGDARDNTRVSASLKFTADNRRKMSRIYLDTTADQGRNVNLPN
jgi:hypothetical protein